MMMTQHVLPGLPGDTVLFFTLQWEFIMAKSTSAESTQMISENENNLLICVDTIVLDSTIIFPRKMTNFCVISYEVLQQTLAFQTQSMSCSANMTHDVL